MKGGSQYHTEPARQAEEAAIAAAIAASLAPTRSAAGDNPVSSRNNMGMSDDDALQRAIAASEESEAALQPEPQPEPAAEHEPRSQPETGNTLCIMRHSLRLDNELDKIDESLKENQHYWKNKFNYNTPLANDENIVPQVPGFSLKTKANDRILESIERGLREHDFKCIITSPFTRCLQTAEVVRIMLGIRPEDIFINYNLREADSALSRYVPIKYRGPEWNTPEPYNQGLIAGIAKGGIESYVKQTVNDIFNKYKHLGNVLFITHGDVYNEYAPKIPGNDIGATRLEEAGWAIFQPPSNEIVSHAGEGFFNTL